MAWLKAVVSLSFIPLFARAALAAWPSDGLPVASGPIQQRLPIGITAPEGDLLTFWSELGQPFSLRAQRNTIQGTLASGWPEGGRGVLAAPASASLPELVADGAGGYLLAWYDFRSTGGARGIYAARLDGEAAVMPGWSNTGTPICTTFAGPLNDLVRMCPDGSGGAFVAWTDSRNTPPLHPLVYDVYAHHVRGDGTLDPAWPAEGRSLTSGDGYKYPHAMIADATGGFWRVSENPAETSQILVAHHASDGGLLGQWTTPSFASQPRAVSDGAGGIFVTWRDCRNCLTVPADGIFLMRLGPWALPRAGWPDGGLRVAASTRDDKNPTLTASDGAVVVAWLETGGAPNDEFLARRVESNGAFSIGWPVGGRAFATSTDILDGWPLIVPDGAGGAMFAFRRNLPNLFGSRVTAGGRVPSAFPDTGLSLCSIHDDQFLQSLVSDGLNGAYVLWEDRRAGGLDVDVYAMRFTREGEVGATTSVSPPPPPPSTAPRVALSRPAPNPTFGSCAFRLSVPGGGRARVEVMDLRGRHVVTLLDEFVSAATVDVQWDGRDGDRRSMPPGIYLVRARVGGDEAARRIVRLE
jgi:hypothetical protein